MRDHPCELRADFQQYYNLDSDGIGGRIRCLRAADLAAMLPQGSRCALAMSPQAAWSNEAVVMAMVDFRLQQILYSLAGGKAKDGSKLPKPDCLYKPGTNEREADGMTVDEMREFLSRPRTVENGN